MMIKGRTGLVRPIAHYIGGYTYERFEKHLPGGSGAGKSCDV